MASEDLRRLRAARGYTKASITRLFNFSNNENDVGLSAISDLETKRARIAELFKDYEQCNKEILALDEADAEDVEDYEAKYYNILTILNEAIKNKSSSSDAPSSDAPASSCKKAKLPTIKIETFTGKYSEYTGFINLFKAIIHNDRSIDNVQKLYYLRSFLANEPFDLIKNLPLAEGSYEEALKLLEERYNHRFKIVNEHINSLLDINALVKSNPANLRQFVSCIKQSLSALKNLNVSTDNWNPIILAILYRKLDTYTSRAYQLERDDTEEPTVTEFLLYLEKRALALENAEPSPTPGKSHHKAVVNVLLLEPVPGQQERSAQPVEDPASPHPTVVNTKFGYIIDRWRWLYVPSGENPSDCLSRGTDPDELRHIPMWLHGPSFLQEE
ncbi:uncharacterized protein LOC134675732 [Cydia fagiglandana]|uniref:uncharacterized protein LOC134675732 n=1 Tax=Cydia fagiglandana TaxID=1458189 RepID=UPI002FEE44F8